MDDDTVAVDYAALFDAAPSPYLVLDRGLRIVTANRARLAISDRRLEDLVGRYVFDAYPSEAGSESARLIRESFERVLATGEPETMAVQRYDVRDGDGDGGMRPRYWSPINVPVRGPDGEVALLLHRVEDVTDFVHHRLRVSEDADPDGTLDGTAADDQSLRLRAAEADLFARSRELAEVNERLRLTSQREVLTARRLAGLAEVALRVADADTVDELTATVIEAGVAALGADGGAVAVRGDDGQDDSGMMQVAFASIRESASQQFQQIDLDGPLPASLSARTGERILLSDREAGLAWSPAMAEIHETTGLEAWASLPLRAGGRLLGSLSVGWRDRRDFPAEEVELLDALAAQCASALHRLQRLTAERHQSEVARAMAETLQRSLLTDPPEPDHLHVVVRYLPAAQTEQVGGDWFDAFLTPDGATSVVIGDVTGHDRDAVAAMGQVRNILRGVAYTLVEPPAAVLSALDHTLRGMAVDTLATVVLGTIEQTPEDAEQSLRTFRWSNAGHLPPLLLHPDGRAELLQRAPNLLLGLVPTTPRDDHEVKLLPSATVILYTDGLVERREEALPAGLERLRRAAEELADLPLDELCDALLERLAPVRDDDIALAAVRAHPEDEPRPPEAGPRVVPADGSGMA